ncbi:S1 family peptidase [Actinacidiphila bryophytorum]|uniref:S1 family peptidase n=1 Tax=Actinacidiphila bryophytorum TaxID=1436133 RepID=UPI002176B9BD|nr:serine protease [Actinacidiphila bryophytorum]UWE12832.1 serine protease [Actinacidiphila bryophytorum]
MARGAWVVVRGATSGALAGAGVVVGDGIVLTCAHVVNAALDRVRFAAEEPSDADLAGLTLTLPAHGTGAETYRPTMLSWTPARPSARPGRWEGDLALLRLPEGAPRPTPVRFADAAMGRTAWVWYASGDGRTAVDVLVQKPLGPWLLLDPGSSEVPVRHGYSGSPLWDSASGTAVGLMVSVEPEVRRYYALAPAVVREALAAAGLAAAGPRDPRQEWLHRQAAEALAALPEERFRRGAHQLAWSLGLPGPPARPEDAADAALAHPRGLPALRDAFTEPAARPAAGSRAIPRPSWPRWWPGPARCGCSARRTTPGWQACSPPYRCRNCWRRHAPPSRICRCIRSGCRTPRRCLTAWRTVRPSRA